MITKEDAIKYVKHLAEDKILTRDELDSAYSLGLNSETNKSSTKKSGIVDILYYIGGAIVFLGIAILISQNWDALGSVTRVLVTLGVGIAAYFVGILFDKDIRTKTVSSAFYLISALVIPVGLFVVFDNAGFDFGSYGVQTLVSGILFFVYLLSYYVLRRDIFILFSIIFGTLFFLVITDFMVGGAPYFEPWKFYMYRILVIGATYMLLAYSFSKGKLTSFSGFLYGFGVFGFLGSALALGGWSPNQNVFWELIYPGLVFGALFISVHIKSKAFLTWGTIFLMIYILKITSQYFSTGLGWPFALVLAGLAMIGVGYMSIALNKKYMINR